MSECKHKRLKENFPFGKHSTSRKYCKDCGDIVSKHTISKRIKELKKKNRKQYQDDEKYPTGAK